MVALLVVEAGLRLAGLGPSRVWEPHPQLGWHHVPGGTTHFRDEGDGWVQINSLGYRDRERSLEKSPGTYRIAVIGDSMTEAVQVNLEQSFCHLLEESLKGRGRPCEVLNMGVSGFGPLQELLLFRQEGPRYRPDCVVLALFLDNDVADSHPNLRAQGSGDAPYAVIEDGRLHFDFAKAEQAYADYHREPIFSLRKYSSMYHLLSVFRTRARARLAAHTDEGVPGGDSVPKRYRLYRQPLAPEWQQAWTFVEQAIVEFAAEARRLNAEFVLLSLPAGQIVSPASWEAVLAQRPAMAAQRSSLDLGAPEARLQAFAKAQGIRFFSGTTAFRQAAPEPPLFFGNVGHLTARGHQLMAQLLEQFLAEQRLIPKGP
jgi:hypothetical protein